MYRKSEIPKEQDESYSFARVTAARMTASPADVLSGIS